MSNSTTATTSNPSLAAGRRWTTRQICIMALFVALGVVLGLLQISILPMVPFLQLDIAAVPAIIAGLAFGPLAGCIVGALTYIVQGLLVGEFGGEIINVFIVCAMVIPSAKMLGAQRKSQDASADAASSAKTGNKGMVGRYIFLYLIEIGLVAVLGFIWNMTYTVWLYGMTQQAMLETLIVWIVLFNVIKVVVDLTVAILVFQSVRPLLVNERGKKKTVR